MAEANRDQNYVPVALGQSSTDASVTLPFKISSSTGRLLTDSASGSGDVVGPASSTDNAVALWDGATGKLLKDSTIKLVTTVFSPTVSDGNSLGSGALMWSDLFLASGAVVNFNNGNVVMTHSAGILTMGTGEMRITTAGTNTASVITQGSTNALSNKTLGGAVGNVLGAVTMTLGSDADGDTYYRASNVLTRLPKGTAAQVLTMNAGATAPEWATPTAAVPTLITVANEATDTSCFIAFFTDATGNLGPKTNVNMTFNSNTGVVTFASSVLTTTDINGGTIDGTVIGGASAAAGTFTLATAEGFSPTSTTATGNRMYLPAANTIGFAINGTGEVQLTATALSPVADGGNSLGTTALGWQNLFGNTGFVFNIENGDWVATHTAGILTVGTGDLRVTNNFTNAASVVTVGGAQTLTNKTLTSPVINTATLGGINQLAEGASISLDVALADGSWSGISIAGTAGATLAFGQLVYLAAADSRWELTDSDSATTADRLLGIVILAAAADGDPTRLLLMGNIRADSQFPAMTIGSAMYISDATAGAIITTIPTGADNVIRRVGYALTADELYFNPSMDAQTTVA